MLYVGLSLIFVSLSSVFGATLVSLDSRRKQINIIWAILGYTIALWSLGFFLTINATTYSSALWWGRFHNYIAILIAPLFFHFSVQLRGEKSKWVAAFYVLFLSLLVFSLVFYQQFIPSVRQVDPFKYYIVGGFLHKIFFSIYTIVPLCGVGKLCLSLPQLTGIKKKQVLYVITAFAIGFFGGGTTFFIPMGINIYPFGIFGVVIYVVMISYAIVQHRVLEISTFISRNIARVLVISIIVTIYLLSKRLLESFFSHTFFFDILCLVLVCEAYPYLLSAIQKVPDRILVKSHYSLSCVLDDLTNITVKTIELDFIIQNLFDLLRKRMNVDYFTLLISSALVEGAASNSKGWCIVTFDHEKQQLVYAESSINPEIKHLNTLLAIGESPEWLQCFMRQNEVDVFVPFISENKSFGAVFLRNRPREYHFNSDDFILFNVFRVQIGTSLGRIEAHQNNKQALKSLAGSIAHEMRNPLGQIQQSFDEIEAQLPSPSPTETETVLFHKEITACYDSLGKGQSAIRRGLQVITTTLNEIKGKQIETEEFVYLSARTSTEKAVSEYGYETNSERDKVQVCGEGDFFFKGDETLYQFVLFNLIKNALFYMKTHPDAEVTIRFQSAEPSTQNMNRVIVKDTGPGIPKAVLSNLFKSFYSSGKKSGTGLGLAYCKRVMVAFGGDIHCESVEGDYTEFILSFPNVSEADVEAAQRRMIDAAQAQLHGKRVLLVDDMEGIRQMTRMHLEPFAMQIDEAENGEIAIHQLQKADYDLVILDLRMPVIDGYRAAELIRSGTCFSEGQCRNYMSLPILALTAEVSYLAQVKTEKVGITHFQSKPCTQIALIQALRTTLEKAAQQKRTAATPLKGKNVLVVDDSPQNRIVLVHNLKPQGVHVIEAATGESALALLDQMPCDLILMDVHMPGIDGLETVRRLRSGKPFSEFKNYEKIPVIALSGDDGEEERAAALSAGMNDYLTKPIQREALLNTLTRWFAAHPPVAKSLAVVAPIAPEKSAPKKQDDLDYLPLLDEGSLARTQAWDAAHAKRLYGYFVAGVEERLEKLETAWEARDMEDFNFHMHTLQGNPGNILAERFPKLVQRMYATVKQGEWPTESLGHLRKVFVETHQAMKEKIFPANDE